MRKGLITSVFSLLIVILLGFNGSHASPHTSLIASNPANGSMLETFPASITLEFSEPFLTIGRANSNYFEVRDELDRAIDLEKIEVAGAVMTAKVADGSQRSGRYEVRYRAVSSDGHVIRGSLTFSVDDGVALGEEVVVKDPLKEGDQGHGPRILLGSLILLAILAGLVIYKGAARNASLSS